MMNRLEDDNGIGFRNGNFYYSVSGKAIGFVHYSTLNRCYKAYLIIERVKIFGLRGLQHYYNYDTVGEFSMRNQAVDAMLDCYDPNKSIPVKEYTPKTSVRATNL